MEKEAVYVRQGKVCGFRTIFVHSLKSVTSRLRKKLFCRGKNGFLKITLRGKAAGHQGRKKGLILCASRLTFPSFKMKTVR